jgi:hypothetical protein
VSDKKKKGYHRYEDKPAPMTQEERYILQDDRLSILEDAKRLVAYGLRVGLLKFRFQNYEEKIHGNHD